MDKTSAGVLIKVLEKETSDWKQSHWDQVHMAPKEDFTEPFNLERFKNGAVGYRATKTDEYIYKIHDEKSYYWKSLTTGAEGINPLYLICDVLMLPETKLTANESDWIEWNGGDCPIPWASSKEYEARVSKGHRIGKYTAAQRIDWSRIGWSNPKIVAYRLTDGWIPILNEKCPEEAKGWKKGEYEIKIELDTKPHSKIQCEVWAHPADVNEILSWKGCVAIRKILQDVKQIPINDSDIPSVADGWIPIVDEKCPVDMYIGEYYIKFKAHNIKLNNSPWRKGEVMIGILAIRKATSFPIDCTKIVDSLRQLEVGEGLKNPEKSQEAALSKHCEHEDVYVCEGIRECEACGETLPGSVHTPANKPFNVSTEIEHCLFNVRNDIKNEGTLLQWSNEWKFLKRE